MTDLPTPIPWVRVPPSHQRRVIALLSQLVQRHWQQTQTLTREDTTNECENLTPLRDNQRQNSTLAP